MPAVLIVGAGPGHLRPALVDRALADLLAALKAGSRRHLAFDSAATAAGALDGAAHLSTLNTSGLLGSRHVCVLRRVDELPPEDVPRLKRVAASRCQWWIMTAASAARLRALDGFFLTVRAREPLDMALRRLGVAEPHALRGKADVAKAVGAGASVPELVEAFWRLARDRIPPRDAALLAARLDTDLRANRRPLMISPLIEDAILDLEDLHEAGAGSARASSRSE
eukprot:jgi/Tetstr1/454005/TSEL_040924.t1